MHLKELDKDLYSVDDWLDQRFGRPGTPSRDAFRREARAFCEEKTASKKTTAHKAAVLSH